MDLERFKGQYEAKQVKEKLNNVNQNPLVSVCVQTYNHFDYIKQCLDGILFQKTNFEFEILLGEDDSTDGTRELCVDYANRYPDKIRLFLHHRVNNIKIGGQPTGRFNLLYNLYSVQGKYIAMCEGDDYWTDPLKLQKQVDFLEENEDFGLIHTNSVNFNQRTRKFTSKIKNLENVNNLSKIKLFFALIDGEYRITTASVLFRNNLLREVESNCKFLMGDTPLWLQFSQLKKFKFLNNTTTVYRMALGSATRKPSFIKKMLFIHSAIEMRIYYSEKLNFKVKSDLIEKYNKNLVRLKKLGINQTEPMYPELLNNKTKFILSNKMDVIKIFKNKSFYIIKNYKTYLLWLFNKV
jgi:glycosyltransferase involved in cell wall biosynthesis